MSNCLVCNDDTIKLFDLNNSSSFNYCNRCFHCQIFGHNNQDNNTYTTYNDITIKDFDIIKSLLSQNNKSLFITPKTLKLKFSNSNNLCQILFTDFLEIDENSTYEEIIFYKTFDKTHDIKAFLKKCKRILNKTGEIIIVTSTENVILDRKYDNINENVVSYFCTNSMKTLCEQFGLIIKSINKNENDNFSIYKIAFKNHNEIGCSNDVITQLYSEIECNLYDDKTYILFNLYGLYLRNDLKRKLSNLNIKRMENLEKDGAHFIVGYGDNIDSINLVNFCELTCDYIDYFLSYEIDSSCYVGTSDIEFRNYWSIVNNIDSDINEFYGSQVTIINFTNSRINDTIYNSFITLYGPDIKIINAREI